MLAYNMVQIEEGLELPQLTDESLKALSQLNIKRPYVVKTDLQGTMIAGFMFGHPDMPEGQYIQANIWLSCPTNNPKVTMVTTKKPMRFAIVEV